MSPIANVCLDYMPEWLAPNVVSRLITLLGLLCVVVPHIMLQIMYPVWQLNVEVHPAMMVFLGVSHLVYMNFDNIDGKQARKTGNSSPLGLLFDHGCDSLIVFIQGISLATCLRFDNDIYGFMVIYLGAFTFFTTTIEEYYTHIMYLPCVNGAAEGCFGLSIIYFISAWTGGAYWGQDSMISGISNRLILLGCFCLAGLGNLIGIIHRVYASSPGKVLGALLDMSSFLFMTGVCMYVVTASATGSTYLKLVVYIFGFNFAKLVVSKLTNTSLLSVLLINTMSGNNMKTPFINELTVLWVVAVLSLSLYAHLVFNAIEQFCRVLKIRAFVVKDREGLQKISTPAQYSSFGEQGTNTAILDCEQEVIEI